MKLVYDQYREDGQGRVPVQRILQRTNMLKSLANRTVNALCRKGYLQKARGEKDARSLFVSPVPEQLPAFLAVHRQSLALAERIIAVIGEEDALRFVRSCEKLSAAGVRL